MSGRESSIEARQLSLPGSTGTSRTEEAQIVSTLIFTALLTCLSVLIFALQIRIKSTTLGSDPSLLLVGMTLNSSVSSVGLEILWKAEAAAAEEGDVAGPLWNSSVSCIADSKILPPVLGPLMCQSMPYRPRLKTCMSGCSAASKNSSPFIVRPYGGLANRLRVITSYLVLARETSRRLVIQWSKTSNLGFYPTDFCELFQISSLPQDIEIDTSFSIEPNFTGTGPYVNRGIEGRRRDGPLLLASLIPLPELAARINAVLHQLGCGSFLAMHVRRTDLNSNYDADIEFVKWANEQPSLPVFLATDNNRTLNFIRQKLGSRLVTQVVDLSPPGSQRFTSIQSGLIDMWVASYAIGFMGTFGSTFSIQIDALREARGLHLCGMRWNASHRLRGDSVHW